ncbi:PREDICTED: uncharacterized protein LOC107334576 isoform X2 [Acropora digitifera]|uniref:uncharacterized protein LOC107334576 isoform X2 n=1 Tax=Acropora digitifera TaxID=70779 RepID=UPI00077A3BED|nr:PREDICTED: uncharacterized protein LOC107334576 isoform X2 [Acropora digitifera]
MSQQLGPQVCLLLCLLFGFGRAYEEVGVSSYLQENVDHMSVTGMTLVKAWSVSSSRRGMFLSPGVGENTFQGTFKIPKPGIYFVASNLMMTNATDGFLMASLVINSDFKETSGIDGMFGNTSLNESLNLSGFLRLYQNDFLSLYLHGSGGTLLRESTFSVLYMSSIGSVPGFHALLSRDQLIQNLVKTRIGNWRASGSKGVFLSRSGTSLSVGMFCAIIEGIHKFMSNIDIHSNGNLTRFALSFELNSNVTLLRKFSSGGWKYSTGVSGMFYLYRGDCVQLQIEVIGVKDLILKSGSSFSGLFLGIQSDDDTQFSVTLPRRNISAVWNRMQHSTAINSIRNFKSENAYSTLNNGVFTCDSDGLFLVTALINMNSTFSLHENFFRLLVSVGNNVRDSYSGQLIVGAKSSGADSLIVSGVVELGKGVTVSVYIYCGDCDGVTIDGLFSVVTISPDWPGVSASLKDTINLQSSEWTRLTRWKTSAVPGSFSFDNALSPTDGAYRTRVDGTYFLSCNAIFNGQGKGNLSLIIAIDDDLSEGHGLLSLNENPNRDVTLNVAGSIKLRKNQSVSVFVATTEPNSWSISIDTSFFVALVGSKSLHAPGFFAVKSDKGPSAGSSNGEISGWRTIHAQFDSLLEGNSAQWNARSGRFKADEDGFYLVAANVLIRHSGSSKVTMKIVRDDGQRQQTALTTFCPSDSRGSQYVDTLTIAGITRLNVDQKISIFITEGLSLEVLPNSSFSVVLISRWKSDYAAGFVSHSTQFSFNGNVYYWNTTVSKNLFKERNIPVVIKDSGLYFLQSAVAVVVNNDDTVRSRLKIDNNIVPRGFTSLMRAPAISTPFVLGAFGVLYLRKGQKVDLYTEFAKPGNYFRADPGSWFSMARLLAPAQQPGLFQTLTHVQRNALHHGEPVVSNASTAGDQLAYIQGKVFNPNASSQGYEDIATTLTGTYLVSIMFTISGKVPGNFTACTGPRRCAECYVQVSGALSQYHNTYGFVGLVDLTVHEPISVCFKSNHTFFTLTSAKRSVHYLSELNVNKTFQLKHRSVDFPSRGWHELTEWKTKSGQLLQRVHVVVGGLYILCANLEMKAAVPGVVGVKFEATGLSNIKLISTLASVQADSTEWLSVSVISRLNASEVITVSQFTSSSLLNIGDNATFFAALLTNENDNACLLLRSRKSVYDAGKWWQGIEPWDTLDQVCLSPNSDASKGRFVADIAGVYFVTAVLTVRTTGVLHDGSLVELLLSVNGDTTNGNGLRATKQVPNAGYFIVLSFSATVHLEPWQTLYLMIRGTGAGSFEVVNGSTFGVALIEETKYFKNVATNIVQFDNGPQIISHPPPSMSLGDDLELAVSWTCEAVANGPMMYTWLRDKKTVTSSQDLTLVNVREADSGQYVCMAEYDTIKVFSHFAQLDVFETNPQFESKEVTSPENSNISLQLAVLALDKQRGPANVSVSIIKGNKNGTFALSRSISKGNISLRNQIPLDYEATRVYSLTLLATNLDTNKTSTANVTIILTDVNDNPPIFTSRNETSVKENVVSGTTIFQVKTVDADFGNNSIVTYHLLPGEYSGKFSIGVSSGNVTLTGELDYENTTEVILRIQATDGKFLSNTTLVINVEDVNDNYPYFSESSYSAVVPENISVGYVVIRVAAEDKDSGSNGKLTYSLVQGKNDTDALLKETFSVNSTNGAITSLKKIKLNASQEEFMFQVNVSDNGIPKKSVSANVTITVIDINDNPPIFISRNNTFVRENVTNGTIIFQVKAVDADFGNNSIVTYYLLPGEYSGKFSIGTSSGNITLAGELDYENTTEVILRIQATDGKFVSNTTLFINVEDVNDNSPYFNESSYSVVVPENIPIGYVVIRVAAQDRDSGSNGQLTYSLQPESHHADAKFSINATTGAITTRKVLKVHNVQETYNFVVQVIDHGNPSLKSKTNLSIIVEDINDSPPEFKQCKNFTSQEPVEEGRTISRVSATDADYGSNANIAYSLDVLNPKVCTNEFEIVNDSKIQNLEMLDWGSNCTIRITASDGEHTVFCVLALLVAKKPEQTVNRAQTDELRGGTIALIVIGIFLFVTLVCLLIWYFRMHRRPRSPTSLPGPASRYILHHPDAQEMYKVRECLLKSRPLLNT